MRRCVPEAATHPRGNVFGHEASAGAIARIGTSETKVADLELAICVDEEVAGLEVTMEDICRVDVLQPPTLVSPHIARIIRRE